MASESSQDMSLESIAKLSGRAMHPAWVENEPISLLNAARVAYGRDKCHDAQDLLYPSWITVRECVLPTKIYFRYCWLFSGVCERNTRQRVAADESLTDQEDAVRFSRHLMSDTPVIGYAESYAINAFWLLTDGRVILVNDASEDYKLRNIRAQNLRRARNLWREDSNSCSNIIRAAGSAYDKFLRLCGEAAYSSGGNACFYNTYATYPLATTDHHGEQTDLCEITAADELNERDVRCREINTAHALLTLLDPLYQAYFDLTLRGGGAAILKETVRRLGAEWLVEQERTELRIASEITHSWFIRFLVRLTMLFSMY